MKKIIVIGCPGSGKSTFSRALHKKTGIPLFYLDMLYWNADKTTVNKSIFLARLLKILENDCYIIDGNYGSTMELRMKDCDTVFFLDYDPDTCLSGIMGRMGKPREDMPWIETEEDSEFMNFIRAYPMESRNKVMELIEKYRDKNIIIFHSREESDIYLKNLS